MLKVIQILAQIALTSAENVATPLIINRVKPRLAVEQADEVLRKVGFDEHTMRSTPYGSLSRPLQHLGILRYSVVSSSLPAQEDSLMKTRDDDLIYEVLGFHDGTWVWRGYGDSLGEGRGTLPQEVYNRLAQGITGEFVVGEQVYWIRQTRKELDSK